MIYSNEAAAQVDALQSHYERIGRPEAVRNLAIALSQAEARIQDDPEGGLPAPRPYPELASAGEAWIKAGRYWITYGTAQPPVILGVFFETADIPNRF